MIKKCQVIVVMENHIQFEIVTVYQNSKLFRLPILRNYAAITLGKAIYCKEQIDDRLLKHESEHVRQQFIEGMLTFYFRYVMEFIKLFFVFQDWKKAYRAISYERAARLAEEKPFILLGGR